MIDEPIVLIFFGLNILMTTIGIPCSFFPKLMPSVCLEVFLYGKSSDPSKLSQVVKAIQVPKRWFTHFYIFGTTYSVYVLTALFCYVFLGWRPSACAPLGHITLVPVSQSRIVADPKVALFAALLFTIHLGRRLYETLFLNIFSNAKMNLVHYISGIVHYYGAVTSLLIYSVDPVKAERENSNAADSKLCYVSMAIGSLLFVLASYTQYKSNLILADLRRDNKIEKYSLPNGGLFDYVSCPHYFTEILIYLSLFIILGINHYAWAMITLWVTLNQILSGYTCHQWYLKNMQKYPKSRKAVIPFLL